MSSHQQSLPEQRGAPSTSAASRPAPLTISTSRDEGAAAVAYYGCGSPTDVAMWSFPTTTGQAAGRQPQGAGSMHSIFQRFFSSTASH